MLAPSNFRRFVIRSRCWLLLGAIVLVGCKARPVSCKATRVSRAAVAGSLPADVPFDIETPGPELALGAVETMPLYLTFTTKSRVRSQWMSFGHVASYADLVYSTKEGLARNADDAKEVFPMKRFSDGATERVRFGFRSRVCTDPEALAGRTLCSRYGQQEVLLVADMACGQVDASP